MGRLEPFELDTIVVGDCLDVMRQMPDGCVDTIITDPPYGLRFMGKDWDRGVPGIPYWEAALRVAKPGAMLMAFGGTRTHHRLMCAIEDAGWEIRDVMMWVYGSGFPKSHDISKAIDKAAGAERIVMGMKPRNGGGRARSSHEGWQRPWMQEVGAIDKPFQITAPATDAAKLWDGWGTALKPAWEPVIIAMKPREGTFAENALKWGVAGLWIDGGRIITERDTSRKRDIGIRGGNFVGGHSATDGVIAGGHPQGRWPANFALVHHAECVRVGVKRVKGSHSMGNCQGKVYTVERGMFGIGNRANYDHVDADGLETVPAYDCHPDCPVRMLGEQSGSLRTGGQHTSSLGKDTKKNVYGDAWKRGGQGACANTVGTAARFFYCAKASRAERTANGEVENRHPTVKPLGVVEYLCKLTMTPTGGLVFDPFIGSGTTAVAAKQLGRHYFGCDINPEYVEMARKRVSAVQLAML